MRRAVRMSAAVAQQVAAERLQALPCSSFIPVNLPAHLLKKLFV